MIIDDPAKIREIARSAKRVAVLGIKTEKQAGEAAYYVPQSLASRGVEILPVPVYYPDVEEILGQQVYRRVADVPGPIDIVDVFRRSADVAQHVADLIAAKPKVVWLQSGIRNDEVAQQLSDAGIDVVQDRCLMVEHRR